MSRINAVWSNSDQWADGVPDLLKQPMTIAFGGAILAHVIFFLGLPSMVGKENSPNTVDTPVVQLTPQDLSQIPPDMPQSQVPGGTLLPSTGSLTPSILSPSLISPSTPLPSMPPLDSGTTVPLGINFGSSSGSLFSTDLYPGLSSSPNSTSNLPSEPQKRQSQAEVDKKMTDKKAEDKKIPDQNTKDESKQNKPVDPSPPISPTPPTGKGGQSTAPIAVKPTPQPSPKVPAKSNEEIIAANPKLYAFNLNQPQPTQATQNRSLATFLKEKNLVAKLPKTLNDIIDTPDRRLPYPKEVQKQPVAPIPDYVEKLKLGYGTATVAILVDRKGIVADERTILESTGYPVLDEYAVEYVNKYVKSRQFPVTIGDEYYMMKIPIAPPTAQAAVPAPAS